MHVHLAPGPRFGQSRPGTCAPTTTVEKYTNPVCSPTICTILPQRFLGKLSALQLWSSDTLSGRESVTFHVTTHLECLLRQGFAIHPPLWLEYRFDNIPGFTVSREGERFLSLDPTHLPADWYLHRVVFGIDEKSGLFKGRHDIHPGVEPFHTLSWGQSRPVLKSCTTNLESLPSVGIEGPVVVENVDEREVVTDSNLIIVSIMRRGNLDGSSTELHVDDNRVRDDWDSAINERMGGKFSVKMLQHVGTNNTEMGFMGTYSIPGVVRMDCNCGISKHRFRSGGSNDDPFVCEGV